MKHLFLAGVMVVAAITSAHAAPYKTLRLKVGEQYPLTTQYSVKRSAIGNPAVASLNVLNSREFLLTGKTLGSTQLLLWQAGAEPTTVQIDVVPDLPASSTPGVAVDANGASVQLEGKTHSLTQHDQLLTAAGAGVQDNTVQSGAIQVQTNIRIVEYSRSQLKQIGTAFAYLGGDSSVAVGSTNLLSLLSNSPVGALIGNTVSGADASSILIGHATNSFRGAINALQQNGYAYTLAEPSLVSLSGQTASFLAGGEFPYPVSNQDGQVQIEFKEFGIRLNLTPTVLSEDSIMLKVAPEVSDLDFNSGVQASGVAVPLLRVRRTDTAIQMAPGESFIISGLVSQNTFKNADKIPGLGDIPILGALFRSTKFEQEDKELVMIVTPHLVKPIAKGTKLPELPGEIYSQYTPSFLDLIFDPEGQEKATAAAGSQSRPADVGFAN
ncbi:type II and III secretion system protein family protein [Spongiibacter taiwanensis]|uniref:type II and III secretion system protein family protein n=1 Tax=Spongiibacter taiwanensis TaxID=1748242 RepID=UPI002034B86B|nr:type II and III secretion system protein family protein [Spongiibacter taiwanensis]USA43591.1 type II and III secretion system protein family protein [Spongiibacter taiwanensis]